MFLSIICASIALTLASPGHHFYSLDEGHELFESFIKDHDKQYQDGEKEARFKIFLDNLKEINSLNEKSSNAVFGITKFTDLTKDEFIKTYTGFKANTKLLNDKYIKTELHKPSNCTAPDEFDWRSRGVVSKVKDQAQCGSCWAFSVTGNVESVNAIKTGSIVEISEQQLVDCDKNDFGCSGGYPETALAYLVQHGAMSSESYPYVARDGKCRFNSNNVVIRLQNYKVFHIKEKDIKEKLFNNGPLSIAIDSRALKFYSRGILVQGCSSFHVDHAVLLVGYGRENGVDFWIVKNSWGAKWGEEGYFRMKKGVNCLNFVKYGVVTAII